jgi:pimeloyl-ACP methyl ester carboxylesterase
VTSHSAGSSGTLFADGPAGRLAYRDSGPPDGAVLVFVHGVNMASPVWDPLIAALPGFRCIAFDLRGHGMSGRRGPFTVLDYAADLDAVLGAARVERAQLVCVSLGGIIGCAYAQRSPERVHSVVAFGSALRATHPGIDAGMARLREVGTAEYFGWSLPRGSLPANATPDVTQTVISLAVIGREDTAMVEEITRAAFDMDPSKISLGPSGRPVLVVTGNLDTTCPPEAGRLLAATVGGSWRLVIGGGHVLPLEQPETCAQLVARFYQEPERGGTGASAS